MLAGIIPMPPTNVSTFREFSLFNNGLMTGSLGRIPNAPPFGGYDDKLRLPSMESRYHVDGLGNDPPNQSVNVTVRSPPLSEFDYYDKCRNVPGIPMFVHKEPDDNAYPDEDLRVDITNVNYRLELAAIAEERHRGYRGRGTNFLKRKLPYDDGGGGDATVTRGWTGDSVWPAGPGSAARSGAIADLLPQWGIWQARSVDWIRNYGDIGTDFNRRFKLSGFSVTMANDAGDSEDEVRDITRASYISRAIVMGVKGNFEVKNLFSPNLKRGDRTFFVVAPTQVSQLDRANIVKPDGSASYYPGIQSGECVQVRGVSTADDFSEFVSSQSDFTRYRPGLALNSLAMDAYRGGYVGNAALQPFASDTSLDIDYALKNRVMKYEGFIFEDDGNGSLLTRVTDDVEDLPESIVDIYSMGHLIKVGLVTYIQNGSTDRKSIMDAHRDMDKMIALPTIRIIC